MHDVLLISSLRVFFRSITVVRGFWLNLSTRCLLLAALILRALLLSSSLGFLGIYRQSQTGQPIPSTVS
jgi:hypothetical protein